MLIGTQNMTRLDFILWMLDNNPEVSVADPYDYFSTSLISSKPLGELKLPEGWWYCKKNCLTNEGSSSSGISHYVEIRQS